MTMRLATTILCACLLAGLFLPVSTCGKAYAQTPQPAVLADGVSGAAPQHHQATVTLHLEQVPLSEALRELSQKSALEFLYSSAHVPSERKITLRMENVSPETAMQRVLEKAGLTYRRMEGGPVVPIAKPRAPRAAAPQTGTIAGTVTAGATGETLPGVNVRVVGTQRGAATGPDGEYTITGVEEGTYTVRASYVGYGDEARQGVQVQEGQTTTVDFEMQPQAAGLDEVVVIGYGEQQRRDLTGSISSVSGSEIEDLQITSVEQALEGQMAGVQVRTNSHAPGGSISVDVRGTGSISASSQPLYVVDGFPVSHNPRSGYLTVGGDVREAGPDGNPLSSLDPSDIASIEVLKGPSATAIYGSRGSNGVVLITTKSGQSGESQVRFESWISQKRVRNKLDVLSAPEWAQMANEAAALQGDPEPFSEQAIAEMGSGTDWQSEVFNQPVSQKYELSVTGGSDDLQYFVSGDYLDDQGVIRESGFKRYSARLNLDSRVSDNLKIGSRFTASYTDRSVVPTGSKGYGSYPNIMFALFRAPPTVPATEDGALTDLDNYTAAGGNTNPLEMIDYIVDRKGQRFQGNLFGEYTLLDGLTFRTRLGADVYNYRLGTYYPIGSSASSGRGGVASSNENRSVDFLSENTLRYETALGDRHRINALAGFTFQENHTDITGAEAWGFPSDYYGYNNLGLANNPQAPTTLATEWTLLSYLSRVNYVLNDRYLFTLTGRVDGSSRFGENSQYGFFPSGAVAWRLSDEPFVQGVEALSNLKLRASYGLSGNDAIGAYSPLATVLTARDISGSAYAFGNQLATIAGPDRIANPDLSWEKTRQFDVGMDVGLFENRLRLTADYYYSRTTDLLLSRPLPTQSGFSSVLENVGSIKNTGVELAVQSNNFAGAFDWRTNVNISFNRNEVLSLGGAPYLFAGWAGGGNVDNHSSFVARLEPGRPVGLFYGSVYEGIWRSQEEIDRVGTMPGARPGDMRFADVDGNGTYNPDDDDTYVGDPNPDFTFGLGNTFSYRQWSLNVFLNGSYGNDVLNLTQKPRLDGADGTSSERLDRWTPEEPGNPQVGAASSYREIVSSAHVEDGSYVRVKRLRLSYEVPTGWVNNAQVYLAAENLVTFSSYSGYDPDVNAFGYSNVVKGVDRFSYPAFRSFRLGVDLTF